MAIIPKFTQAKIYKAGAFEESTSHSIGTAPTTVDLSSCDYLHGLIVPSPGSTVYGAWGDSINTSTAPIKEDSQVIFDFTADPLPDNSNLTFQASAEGGKFNYQTASKILII